MELRAKSGERGAKSREQRTKAGMNVKNCCV